jgi:hypothetical protein
MCALARGRGHGVTQGVNPKRKTVVQIDLRLRIASNSDKRVARISGGLLSPYEADRRRACVSDALLSTLTSSCASELNPHCSHPISF